MCFSATASFGVSAVLLTSGVASVKYLIKSNQIPFAVIPFIFAVQQFCEGMLWISLTYKAYANYQDTFSVLFLIFAQIVWPIWVPLSFWFLEKKTIRKKIIFVFLLLGMLVSFWLAYFIFSKQIYASISSHHIRYNIDYKYFTIKYIGLLYCIPTIISPIISSIKKVWIIGVSLLVSYLISKLYFNDYVISVWCFFAAIISVIVVYIMKSEFNDNKTDN